MKHFADITTATSAKDFNSSLGERTLTIYSPTSLDRSGITKSNGAYISSHTLGKDAFKIEDFAKTQSPDLIVGIGGGTTIDIAKYAACLIGCKFVCIPSMLSTNAFATNKVALMRGKTKVTLDASLADLIIFDQGLIAGAGVYNLYGLCDVLSIHTALYDWRLADNANIEKIDSLIYGRAETLLDNALTHIAQRQTAQPEDIAALYSLIGESGHITNLYGSGRPESGSEHIFAKELESRIVVPHGISIALGISLMSRLQGNRSDRIQKVFAQTGIMRTAINNNAVRNEIQLSLESLRPRQDRYTVLNVKKMNDSLITDLIDELYADTP